MPSLERQDQVSIDEKGGYQHRRRIVRDVSAERRQLLRKVSQFIWLLFTVLEILLGLRVILRLIAADPSNSFANFIYHLSNPFLQPFFGLTNNLVVESVVLEVPSIIAMFAYALLGWLIIRVIWLVFYQPSSTIVSDYQKRKVS
jgi:YggT family protein